MIFKFKGLLCIHPGQMGIASVVHLYVFPAKPYELMGEHFSGSVAVLGDYASVDCPIDPDEVRDSERPTKLRLPQPEYKPRSGTTIRESVRDVFLGGGGYVSFFLSPFKYKSRAIFDVETLGNSLSSVVVICVIYIPQSFLIKWIS